MITLSLLALIFGIFVECYPYSVFVICVFAIVMDGHAEMLSTWQPGVVLAMTDPVIQSAFVILVSCCSVNVGGTIDSESYSGLDPKA